MNRDERERLRNKTTLYPPRSHMVISHKELLALLDMLEAAERERDEAREMLGRASQINISPTERIFPAPYRDGLFWVAQYKDKTGWHWMEKYPTFAAAFAALKQWRGREGK